MRTRTRSERLRLRPLPEWRIDSFDSGCQPFVPIAAGTSTGRGGTERSPSSRDGALWSDRTSPMGRRPGVARAPASFVFKGTRWVAGSSWVASCGAVRYTPPGSGTCPRAHFANFPSNSRFSPSTKTRKRPGCGPRAAARSPVQVFFRRCRCGIVASRSIFPELDRVIRRASAMLTSHSSVRAVACARAERMESALPPSPALRNPLLDALPVTDTAGVGSPLQTTPDEEPAFPLSGSTPDFASPHAFASTSFPRPAPARSRFLLSRSLVLPSGPHPIREPATGPSHHTVDRSAFVPPGPVGLAATKCRSGSTALAHVARRNPAENRRTTSGSRLVALAWGSLSVRPDRRKAIDEEGNADQRPPARGKPHCNS